jgi:hypothetical protein
MQTGSGICRGGGTLAFAQVIGTEHLLLGLLREERCFALDLLDLLHALNISLDQERERVAKGGRRARRLT